MKTNIYTLFTNPIARLFARISRHCTVTLSTGKVLEFHKGFGCGTCSYEGSMTKTEEQEYVHAMMLMGIWFSSREGLFVIAISLFCFYIEDNYSAIFIKWLGFALMGKPKPFLKT